uniref:Uncharacterized protein n=1 Tax=Timema shepardi TaxID=629360 RepID=A0A7R9FWY3_TIMSH|nr:unnamed protein product [Timema shepardi]
MVQYHSMFQHAAPVLGRCRSKRWTLETSPHRSLHFSGAPNDVITGRIYLGDNMHTRIVITYRQAPGYSHTRCRGSSSRCLRQGEAQATSQPERELPLGSIRWSHSSTPSLGPTEGVLTARRADSARAFTRCASAMYRETSSSNLGVLTLHMTPVVKMASLSLFICFRRDVLLLVLAFIVSSHTERGLSCSSWNTQEVVKDLSVRACHAPLGTLRKLSRSLVSGPVMLLFGTLRKLSRSLVSGPVILLLEHSGSCQGPLCQGLSFSSWNTQEVVKWDRSNSYYGNRGMGMRAHPVVKWCRCAVTSVLGAPLFHLLLLFIAVLLAVPVPGIVTVQPCLTSTPRFSPVSPLPSVSALSRLQPLFQPRLTTTLCFSPVSPLPSVSALSHLHLLFQPCLTSTLCFSPVSPLPSVSALSHLYPLFQPCLTSTLCFSPVSPPPSVSVPSHLQPLFQPRLTSTFCSSHVSPLPSVSVLSHLHPLFQSRLTSSLCFSPVSPLASVFSPVFPRCSAHHRHPGRVCRVQLSCRVPRGPSSTLCPAVGEEVPLLLTNPPCPSPCVAGGAPSWLSLGMSLDYTVLVHRDECCHSPL